MIATVLGLVTSKVGRYLAIAGGVLLAIVTFGAIQRRKGAQGERDQRMRETLDRVQEADDAAEESRKAWGDADSGQLDDELRKRGL